MLKTSGNDDGAGSGGSNKKVSKSSIEGKKKGSKSSSNGRKISNQDKKSLNRKTSKESDDDRKRDADDDAARSVSDSDSDVDSERASLSDFDDDDGEETWRQILMKTVVDYGPPYRKHEDIPPFAVISECADFSCNLYNLHNLLNKRLDPNERDPEDLYFSAMHWCVRNAHFYAMKMLKRAGAYVHILNEFGKKYHEQLAAITCLIGTLYI